MDSKPHRGVHAHGYVLAVVALPLLLIGASAASDARALAGGPVAAYAFDEGNGLSLNDSSGNGNNGAVKNAAWTATGRFGGALLFNGSSSTVVIPDRASLDLSAAMTLEAWLNPSTVSAPAGLLAKAQRGGPSYALYASDGTGFSNAQLNVGGVERSVSDPWITPTNQWNFLAATYDGREVRLYGNGVLVETVALSGPVGLNDNALTIGGNTTLGGFFRGQIDNVRVYARALSQAEVRT